MNQENLGTSVRKTTKPQNMCGIRQSWGKHFKLILVGFNIWPKVAIVFHNCSILQEHEYFSACLAFDSNSSCEPLMSHFPWSRSHVEKEYRGFQQFNAPNFYNGKVKCITEKLQVTKAAA